MKTKISIFFAALIISISVKAQITLEHSYASPNNLIGIGVVNLSISGFKYSLYDYTTNKQVRLYNLDHSLWKTINLSVPVGYSMVGVNNISETLFNSNGNVELTYSYSSSSPVAYESKVIDENSAVLLTLPNCISAYAVSTGTNGWKLIASIYGGTSPSRDVYSLPGSMPAMIIENSDNQEILGNAFPNPSQNIISIPYNLPQGSSTGEIIIYDITGKEIQKYQIDNTFNNLLLDVSKLSKGTYIYKIFVNNNIIESKKFITY